MFGIKSHIKLFFLFLFFCLTIKVNAQGGLKFISNDKPKNERTSYIIFDEATYFNEYIEVSFKLSFYNSLYIGEIFSLVNSKYKQEYSLYYKYTYNKENESFIQINRVGEKKLLELKIPDDLILNESWVDVKIKFDFKNNLISFSFNDQSVDFNEDFNMNSGYFDLIFGKHDIYFDVPSFSIRDLKIKSQNKEVDFPLNQMDKNIVYDKNMNHSGIVENPYWLIKDFYHWKKIKELNIQSNNDIVFNKKESSLYVLADSYYLKYNLLRNKIDSIPYKVVPDFVSSLTGKALIDQNNKIYAYKTSIKRVIKNDLLVQKLGLNINDISVEKVISKDKTTLALFDISSSNWMQIQKEDLFEDIRFHNNSFLSKDNKHLFFFGGYSNFKFHNDFRRYDLKKNKYDSINLTGDIISPRFYSGHTFIDKNKILLYGGVGNLSGEEHIGRKYFNELYEIDLLKYSSKLLWVIEDNTYDTATTESMVLSKDKKYFFTGTFAENLLDSRIQLKKIDIKSGNIILVGDNVPFNTNKFPNEIDLFQLNENNRLVLVKKEFLDNKIQENKISIYTLEFEPITYSTYNQGRNEKAEISKEQILIVLIISFIIPFLIFYNFRKRSNKNIINENYSNHIFVRSNRQNIKISLKSIIAIEALKDYIKIVCDDKSYVVHSNISKFKPKLPEKDFLQIHRSYIVNIKKITSIDGNLVYLDKKYYKLGGKYINSVKEKLNINKI